MGIRTKSSPVYREMRKNKEKNKKIKIKIKRPALQASEANIDLGVSHETNPEAGLHVDPSLDEQLASDRKAKIE